MKEIYIVLTYSGTVLSKLIKEVTRAEFAHVSISLDENLDKMYSFGRLNAYNPFIAGFVREGIDCQFFKRFKNTKAEIFSLPVTDEQYRKMEDIINKMENGRWVYKFNIIGLFAAGLNIRVRKKYSFYCAEFVKYLIDTAKIENNLPEVIKPEDFKYFGMRREYKGILQNFPIEART